jgi:hypothetical protein
MASCGEIRLLLGPFDDGELEPHEMEEVAFHVVACLGCKAALEDYRALGVALRRVVADPPLDNFAQAVIARLDLRRIPLGARVAQWWESLGRLGSVIEFTGVAAATTALTLVILGPNVRNFVARRAERANAGLEVAYSTPPSQPSKTIQGESRNAPSETLASVGFNPNLANVADPGRIEAARELQEAVSEMGAGQSPSVAVWSEPRTDTTVVWVPDNQP